MAAAFEELGVMPELIKAVEELGWTLPTPVQAEAVPLILGGGDVMAAAETGSGKTGAFALPVLQIVHETLLGWAHGAAVASAAAAAGPGSSGRRCELSVDDRDSFFSIRDGLNCQSRQEKNWGGVRATLGAFAGKVYYEAEVCDEGLCRVGWSTLAASYDIGTDRHSFGFGGTGKKSHNRQFDSYGQEFGKGDIVGCLLDADEGKLAFSKNGAVFPVAFELPQYLRGQVLYPALCLKNAEMRVNFGDSPFRFGPPPGGYVGLSQAPPSVTTSAAAVAAAAATAGSSSGGSSSGNVRLPLCIVMEPSRDLAEQTHKCFQAYSKYLSAPALSSVLLVGGLDAGPQLKALKSGAEIVVGTPGRIIDFVESGKLPLDKVRFLVLDEADRLMDNEDVVMKLFKRLPKGGAGLARLQVLMFSATLHSPEVRRLAAAICHQPLLVDLKGKDAVPESVDHVLVRIDPEADASWLQSHPKVFTDCIHVHDTVGPAARTPECMSEAVKRLKQRLLQRVIDTHNMSQCLIFCRTNFDCDNLERFLNELGGGGAFRGKRESGMVHKYSCVVLAGQRTMDERRMALQAFKDGDVRFLICTDVAARGIDISGLPYVINMTLPDKSEDYIHRVGRVGRADHMGLAISLVSTVPEKVWFCTIKGFKPWLQPDAQNTKTQEQGGQTIWCNEQQLLQEVEARLSAPISALNEDLSLPAHIQSRLQGEGAAYGQARGGGVSAEMTQRLQSIRQNVEELASLEWQAQTSFLMLKCKWGPAAMVEG